MNNEFGEMSVQAVIVRPRIFFSPCNLYHDVESADSTNFRRVQQKRRNVSQLFIYVRPSTCFRRVFSVRRQELKTAHTASGICQTVTATCF